MITGIDTAGHARAVLRVRRLAPQIGHREHLHLAHMGRHPVLGRDTDRQPGRTVTQARGREGHLITEQITRLTGSGHPGRVLGQAGPRGQSGSVGAEQLNRPGIAVRADVLTGYADRQPAGATNPHGVQAPAEPVARLSRAGHAGES